MKAKTKCDYCRTRWSAIGPKVSNRLGVFCTEACATAAEDEEGRRQHDRDIHETLLDAEIHYSR